MKQVLLALILILVPVAAFSAFHAFMAPKTVAVGSLGDLSKFKTIVADVQTIAKTSNFVAAEKRVRDFETAWDEAEATLRPMSANAWGAIDGAADKAFRALRAASPSADTVTATLSALMTTLDNPVQSADAKGSIAYLSGIAVTDASGHAIPCEEMLKALRSAMSNGGIAQASMAAATEFESKATERCNADDDAHADAFSAQGLALAAK